MNDENTPTEKIDLPPDVRKTAYLCEDDDLNEPLPTPQRTCTDEVCESCQ